MEPPTGWKRKEGPEAWQDTCYDTHIDNQARAVAALLAPKEPDPEKDRKAKDAAESRGDPKEPGSSVAKAG
ncbi:MAG: hypothetical protein KJ000_12240 [Pirellulaceae bacterium]|nr:hypothetical protein [Pirellulaceae bacterium]